MRRGALPLIACLVLWSVAAHAAPRPIQYVVHGSSERIDAYRAVFDRFTAETGIPVEVQVSGSQQEKWDKVLVNVAGGVSPDIVGGVSVEFGEFASIGLLLPLDDLIRRDGLDLSTLVPPFVEALQVDGVQYLLPYGGSLLTMFYNLDHFNEAGLAPPPTEWNTPEWTYSAFVETAKKLTVRNPNGSVARYGVSGRYWDSWITLPYPFGGRWISDDLKTFLGTEPEAVASLQSLQDLIHVHQVMPNAGATTEFFNGTAAMAGFGTWYLQSLIQRPEVNWSFMPWFRVKETTRAAMNPIGSTILASSENIENAWELVKYLTWNEEANRDYAIAAGAIPSLLANLPAWRSYWETVAGPHINTQVVIDQAVSHGAIIQIRKSPAFWRINDIMNSTANQVLANRKPASIALGEVAPQIQNLIDDAFKYN